MAQIDATATRRVGERGTCGERNVVSHHSRSMLDVQQLLREVDMNTRNRKEFHPALAVTALFGPGVTELFGPTLSRHAGVV
jgi:hypothetical protein